MRISVLLLILVTCQVQLQAQTFQWGAKIGHIGIDYGRDIAVDSYSDVIVSGTFNGGVDFDPSDSVFFLASYGISDIFFAKFDADGNFKWANHIGSSGNDVMVALEFEPGPAQSFYTAGHFYSSSFNPGASPYLYTAGNSDIFFAKYDSSGNHLWSKRIGGIWADHVNEMVIDPVTGDIIMCGYFRNIVDFDPGPDSSFHDAGSGQDMFIARYDSNGAYLWSMTLGDNVPVLRGIGIDASGNIYISGGLGTKVDFDPGPDTAFVTSANANDLFIAKYNGIGEYIWAYTIGGPGINYMYSLKLDLASDGDLYIGGSFQDSVDFDPGPGVANLTSAGLDDIFLAKYDSAGNYLWAQRAGGTQSDLCFDIALDTSSGGVYMCGCFKDSADFGSLSLIASAETDIFFGNYDGNGNPLWVQRAGLVFVECAEGIALDPNSFGDVYIVGTFYDYMDLDPGLDTFLVTSSNAAEAFFAKYDSSCSATLNYSTASICSGDSILLEGVYQVAGGTFLDSLVSAKGCDSLVNTVLSFKSTYSTQISTAICPGDSILIVGNYYNSPGTFIDNLQSVSGCDSAVTTTLTVQDTSVQFATATICSNDSILLGGAYQNTAGIYTDSSQTSIGCDSIITTTLTVNLEPGSGFTMPATFFCLQDTFMILLEVIPGGVFGGPGVVGDTFFVDIAGVGIHTITYTITDSVGCSSTASGEITVASTPSASFIGLSSSYCLETPQFPIILTGIPTGGTFTGPGISGNEFDPVAAGLGTWMIVYTYTNSSGCISDSSLSVLVQTCMGTGIERSESLDFSVYPNPGSGEFTLQFQSKDNEHFEMNIFNALGELVLRETVTDVNEHTFDISSYPKGVYSLQLISDDLVITEHIILE
ncbi:MAG: T9SS type A sorting domain-containing protein [Flavobacteriales bacterium]|nr:T9SS type A sorting domain-containing protein [Flavobacteriales bacterium]